MIRLPAFPNLRIDRPVTTAAGKLTLQSYFAKTPALEGFQHGYIDV